MTSLSSRVSNGLISYGWSDDPSADLQEALQAALRAIYLDEKNPYAHYALAMACIFTNAEQAILPAEKAVELSPGFALGHFAVGTARLSSGGASDAIKPFQRGLKLSPHDPQNLAWFNLLATAQLIAGDTEGALLTAARAGGSTRLAANAGNNGLLLRGHRQVGRCPTLCPGDGATQGAIRRQPRGAQRENPTVAASNERPSAKGRLDRVDRLTAQPKRLNQASLQRVFDPIFSPSANEGAAKSVRPE
jgi:tetratricopeptide (TPR) repeat protein